MCVNKKTQLILKTPRSLVKSAFQKIFFSYYSTKLYVVCTQKNRLNETGLLSTQYIRAVTCDFQQCGILTCVDSDEPVQPVFNL